MIGILQCNHQDNDDGKKRGHQSQIVDFVGLSSLSSLKVRPGANIWEECSIFHSLFSTWVRENKIIIQCNNHDNWTSASACPTLTGLLVMALSITESQMINEGGMSKCVPMAQWQTTSYPNIAIVYMKLTWSVLHCQEDHSSSVDERKYIDDHLRNIHQLHG